MVAEAQTENTSSSRKEFESLLNEDFKDRKLTENQIIKSVVTEITKNFIVVDCKAKMEGMIPVEEFKNDNELEKLKVGSTIEVYLERIESFKGEIVISREKARRMNAWKKMEKVFETQEELVGYLRKKKWFIAPLTSSLIGSTVDTFLFFSIAFYATGIPWVTLSLGDLAVKIFVALAMLIPFRLLLGTFKASKA